MIKNRIDVITLGCSKNLVDSERLMAELTASGFRCYHDDDEPQGEVVIVNTCGFIGDAKEESIEAILALTELKRQRKIGRLFVMGCLSERYRKELLTEVPEIDRIYGKFDWTRVLADLGYRWSGRLRLPRLLTTPPHYAYVKVSEGCNRKCAYCAIPLITGRIESRPVEDVVAEVRALVSVGVREFQLIAQDLTGYGIDRGGRRTIAQLVERIAEVPGVDWIRLHYAYPSDFPMDLLDVMARHSNVCRYLDIALQHASDSVLARMRRKVTRAQTESLLHAIREAVPGIHLRTTMMVGFPGETEADFDELCDFVREQRFERLGAFAYSEEEKTYAALHYDDDVPPAVKEQRLATLMDIQQEISLSVQEAKVGQTLRVMIDRQEGDYYVGRTEFDSPEVDPEVLIAVSSVVPAADGAVPAEGQGEPLVPGRFVEARIVRAEPYELYAEVVSREAPRVP